MYVVRRTDQPTDLAVVIRGTNFFSLDDWLSNLRIDPVAWQRSGAETDASITRSTADGLRILQQLRAEPVPPRDAVLTPEEMADAAVVAGEAAVAYQLLQKILTHRQAEDLTAFAARLETLVQDHMKADAALVVRQAEAVKAAASLQPSTTTSTNLMQFLQNYVKTAAAPVNLWVVGHSKGGALAPALALWLGESRSKGTGNWDPENRVALHLATFAAPTPGDGRFAQYVYKMMASTYRLANPDDLVPHVWEPDEAAQIPALYGGRLAGLSPVVALLKPRLDQYGYQHECNAEKWHLNTHAEGSVFRQIGVNHLDAYLQELHIHDERLNTLVVFKRIEPGLFE